MRKNFAFVTAVLLASTFFVAGSAEANDNLVTLIFNYSGTLNSTAVDGSGTLFIDPSTGLFDASISFNRLSSGFAPAAAGWSLLSISCSNAAASEGPPNILTLTRGDYTSIRRVRAYDGSTLIGDFEIRGQFHRVDDKIFEADVLLSGFYNGPTDLLPPTGYNLPTTPQPDGSLRGNTTIYLSTASGQTIRTEHEHTYRFEAGTNQPLVPNVMALTYASNSRWYPSDLVLRVSGTSVIRHP